MNEIGRVFTGIFMNIIIVRQLEGGKFMPLLRFALVKGRDKESLKKLLDVVHFAVVEAFDIPQRDRYQIVHEHSEDNMIIQDTGLGINRTNNIVVLSILRLTTTKVVGFLSSSRTQSISVLCNS